MSRSTYGERGLKFVGDLTELAGGAGRSPYGERGLKLTGDKHDDLAETSLSLRRAWIEMG